MHDVLKIIAYSLFATFLVHKKNIFIVCFFFISFIVAFFAAIMSIEKGPAAWFLLGLYIIYLQIRKTGYVPISSFMKFFLLLLLLLVPFYIFFMGSRDISSALRSIFSRFVTGQITPAYYYLQYFPKYHSFLWGTSFPNPGRILPYTPYRLAVEIMNWKFPNLADRGIVGSAPTVFWGEMYANFGLLGIIFPSFFVGLYVYILHYLIGKIRPTYFTVGISAWLMIHFKNLSGTGLSTFIIDFTLVVVIIVYGFVSLLSGNGKIKLMRLK
jgi:hypothetical protein